MINEILRYQEQDARLIAIEHELENSQQKKEVNKLVEQVKQAQGKLVTLEKTASSLIAEFEKVRQNYEKESQKIEQNKKLDLKSQNEAQLRETEQVIRKEIGGLLGMGKEIKALSNKIASTVRDFEKTKAYGVECKGKYKRSLDSYNAFCANKQAEKEKIQHELDALSKKIDSTILSKYKKMRADNKFPILVPLNNQACGGCAMSLPNARFDLLKQKGVLECENCHRIIYLKD